MADSFRVSIIAEAPEPADPPDPTIEATVQTLSTRTIVMRASNMEQLWARIRDAWKHPDRKDRNLALQIIGHGTSGILHLGSSWMGDPLPAKTFVDPFYLLDTNPWSLNYIGEHRGKFDRVTLVACRVGASEAEGYAINGRTLVYTLCELLQTTIIAATDFTDPEEYDENGEYQPKDHLPPCEWAWREDAEPTYRIRHPAAILTFKRKPGAVPTTFRIIAIRARVPAHVSRITTDLEIRCIELDDPRLLHASRELRVSLYSGKKKPIAADMFGNGRLLRIGQRVYEVEEHDGPTRQIAGLLSFA